ncbi:MULTISPECIES: MarR family winged helix-turn-helix transcriptional regulator [Streptosporangium]|uniref:DNA-binding MarR family transcriptional regulator n=1 Tax=Streptosporangium brasiliense TaxID=47480 RepID=A0ABT9R5M2_9ACTN|nr:MarR family transcriptional regulator [Streptosporangium brasiliense]MDP9864536.1 DNA-binding MarR family transcriptional regulator [Streptosporangium brasiliense]
MSTPPWAGADGPAARSRPRGTAFLLSQVGAHAAARFAERISELGVIPADVGLLRMIAARPGRSQQSLAEEMGVVPSRVVALIDNLERKGLVERRRNPQDRRNYALHLAEEGTRVMTEMRRLGSAHEDDICAALDHTQRAQLAELLEAIAAQQKLIPGVHPGYR